MKVVKSIFKILADIVILLIFVASILVIIASITQKKNGIPNFLGYTSSIVQTDSMAGTIEAGDIIVSKMTDADTVINVDDIVTFSQIVDGTQITITHRVIGEYEVDGIKYYQTQGDNEIAADEKGHPKGDIVSTYCFRVPYAGKVIEFVKKPLGFVLCLVIPMSLFIIYQAYNLIKLYIESKKLQLAEGTPEGATDDMKEAIIKEYLESLKDKDTSQGDTGHEKIPEPDGDAPADSGNETEASEKADDAAKPEEGNTADGSGKSEDTAETENGET